MTFSNNFLLNYYSKKNILKKNCFEYFFLKWNKKGFIQFISYCFKNLFCKNITKKACENTPWCVILIVIVTIPIHVSELRDHHHKFGHSLE
jgi:hypothetical protein